MKLDEFVTAWQQPAPKRRIPMRQSRRSQLPRILLRIYFAAGVLLGLIVLGTVGFYAAGGEQANLSDALYMTLITVTTVGYGEVVPIDTDRSRGG